MKTIETVLREEKEMLEKIIKEARKRFRTAPEGHLRIVEKRNKPEYYYKSADSERSNGRYMKKNETELAQKIAQKDYDIRMIKNAEERVNAISRFLEKYEHTSLKRILECRQGKKYISA